MDRITQDLLAKNHISTQQVERLTSRGVKPEDLLATLTRVGAVSANFVKRFIVEQIRLGRYELSIIRQYDFISEHDILKHLAEVMNYPFIDLDSVDLDYRLAEKAPFAQLKRAVAIPISQSDLNITVVFSDPLDVNAQEMLQRIYPRKPILIAVSTSKQIEAYLTKMEIKDSVKELVANIRSELNSIGSAEESS